MAINLTNLGASSLTSALLNPATMSGISATVSLAGSTVFTGPVNQCTQSGTTLTVQLYAPAVTSAGTLDSVVLSVGGTSFTAGLGSADYAFVSASPKLGYFINLIFLTAANAGSAPLSVSQPNSLESRVAALETLVSGSESAIVTQAVSASVASVSTLAASVLAVASSSHILPAGGIWRTFGASDPTIYSGHNLGAKAIAPGNPWTLVTAFTPDAGAATPGAIAGISLTTSYGIPVGGLYVNTDGTLEVQLLQPSGSGYYIHTFSGVSAPAGVQHSIVMTCNGTVLTLAVDGITSPDVFAFAPGLYSVNGGPAQTPRCAGNYILNIFANKVLSSAEIINAISGNLTNTAMQSFALNQAAWANYASYDTGATFTSATASAFTLTTASGVPYPVFQSGTPSVVRLLPKGTVVQLTANHTLTSGTAINLVAYGPPANAPAVLPGSVLNNALQSVPVAMGTGAVTTLTLAQDTWSNLIGFKTTTGTVTNCSLSAISLITLGVVDGFLPQNVTSAARWRGVYGLDLLPGADAMPIAPEPVITRKWRAVWSQLNNNYARGPFGSEGFSISKNDNFSASIYFPAWFTPAMRKAATAKATSASYGDYTVLAAYYQATPESIQIAGSVNNAAATDIEISWPE